MLPKEYDVTKIIDNIYLQWNVLVNFLILEREAGFAPFIYLPFIRDINTSERLMSLILKQVDSTNGFH